MSRRTFTHVPDSLTNCGELGDHPIMFTAVIDSEQNRFGWSYHVEIVKVVVDLDFGDGATTTVNVTNAFIKNEHIRQKWEDQILRDYQGIMNGRLIDEG